MNVRLKPIMFVGTCSDAGKSVINAAFCRIFKQDGYHPAPFKAQNMSLNSYSTPEGGEMGRAQVVQAEACGIAPHTDMNPVLLKPTNDKSSQVVLNGRPVGNMSARDYFGMQNRKEELFEEAVEAFHRLESRYSPIVLEGAGSISELNLRDRDITNMRMAERAGAATFLVADIDRGGVFGSVYGTIALLKPEERALMKGIIINKFRGDASLFDDGRKIIEDLTGVPVVGVIPWFRDIKIEEEDSVALDMKRNTYRDGKINVAIILLKRMSNFTDFARVGHGPPFQCLLYEQHRRDRKGGYHPAPRLQKYPFRSSKPAGERYSRNDYPCPQKREKGHRHLWRVSDDGSTPRRSGSDRGKPACRSRTGSATAMHDHRTGKNNSSKYFRLSTWAMQGRFL